MCGRFEIISQNPPRRHRDAEKYHKDLKELFLRTLCVSAVIIGFYGVIIIGSRREERYDTK